jgi:hypothetical protein
MLVGLSRADLETSLETLEMMAGEIGASVIVVKEVEVPRAMVEIAEKLAMHERDSADPDTSWDMLRMGSWESRNKKRLGEISESDATSASDPEDGMVYGSASVATIRPVESAALPVLRISSADPIETLPGGVMDGDTDHLILMDPEVDYSSSDADPTSSDVDSDAPILQQFDIDLSIASVFKPRPTRRRVQGTNGQSGPKRSKDKDKDKMTKKKRRGGPSFPSEPSAYTDTGNPPTKAEAKAMKRRAARDKRREERRKALLGHHDDGHGLHNVSHLVDVDVNKTTLTSFGPDHDVSTITLPEPMMEPIANEAPNLAARLEGLHVSHEDATVVSASDPSVPVGERMRGSGDGTDWNIVGSGSARAENAGTGGPGQRIGAYEPRLIVEALVVRKMSLEEGFLDFEGFEVVDDFA